MTAYGRATTETDVGPITVEIISVNRKFLDVQLQMPRVLGCLEMDVRKWISAGIGRGQVTVRVTPHFGEKSPVRVSANVGLARELKRAWAEVQKEFGGELSLELIKSEQGLLVYDEEIEDVAGFRKCLERAVGAALAPAEAMRRREGKVIEEDFLQRIAKLEEMIDLIAERSEGATGKFREKLEGRLKDFSMEEERMLQEVFLYAEKVDMTEEITRFESHLKQLSDVIRSNKGSVGKTLEFLLQELGREINTIAAKNGDLEVARTVVEVKTELERIREQVQNVE